MSNSAELTASYWMHAGDASPTGGRQWSAWDLRDRIDLLAEIGFDGIGIQHADLRHTLELPSYTLEEVTGALEDSGIRNVELEFLQHWLLPPEDYRRREERDARELLFRFSEAVGATHIKVGNPLGYPVSDDVLRRRFAELCEEAAEYGADVAFELFPYDPNVDTLDELRELIDAPENGGALLDIWHVEKSGIDFAEIERLSDRDVFGVELSDGFRRTSLPYRRESLNMRKLPGYGEFDVASFVESVESTGYRGPWGVEMLSSEFRMLPKADAYAFAHDAARRFV